MFERLRRSERVLFAVGATMVCASLAITLHGFVSARLALWAFDRAQAAAPGGGFSSPVEDDETRLSLWSPTRVAFYKQSLLTWSTPPLAVLRIEKVSLRVPVFEGTSAPVLNRGAGWIVGTARPGETGNVGIAGHRDGFFRSLKDVTVGDRLEVALGDRTLAFAVDEIVIVQPEDVHVLSPRPRPSVTLVTCYPFYFVGHAPQRYIVHASILDDAESVTANALRPAPSGSGRGERP
jgi:sortase A